MVTKKSGSIVIVILLVLFLINGAVVDALAICEPPVFRPDRFHIGTRYLDGSPFDPSTDILDIADSLYLSIYAEEEFCWESGFGYGWALVSYPSLATITGGVLGPDAYGGGIYSSPVREIVGAPGDGQWGDFHSQNDMYFGPGLYLDNFLYSPQSVGDLTVSFWHLSEGTGSGYWDPYGVVDSIVIHQVPEPTTITLLALGGLLLRRRRIACK
ncbi:MAG: PEP-CTERM sorting domain-containing protein [Planctomycetes bacterium]|nr:PEP-CTERM sorting domain-containing protein [Planctomycetota bacterium]